MRTFAVYNGHTDALVAVIKADSMNCYSGEITFMAKFFGTVLKTPEKKSFWGKVTPATYYDNYQTVAYFQGGYYAIEQSIPEGSK